MAFRSTTSIVSLLLVTIFCHSVFVSIVDARAWRPSDLPSPQDDAKAVCGRQSLKSSLCDPDGFISQSEADTIDGIINFINERSHGFQPPECDASKRGPQVAVAIVDRMARIPGENKDTTAYEFAKSLHDAWGVGDRQCQNGVVLFVSVSDRVMGISIGKGLTGIFTNSMVPSFVTLLGKQLRTEKYGQAIIYAVTLIGNVLSGNTSEIAGAGSSGSSSSGSFPFFLIFFASFMGLSACSKRRLNRSSNRYNQCKQILERLDNDRSSASRHKYVSTSCPICLEDFEPEDENIDNNNDDSNEDSVTTSATSNSNTKNSTIRLSEDGEDENVGLMTSTAASSQRDLTGSTKRKCGSGKGTCTNRKNNCKNKNGKTSDENKADDENKNNRRTLPCGHSFHEKCVLEWFASPGNPSATCPICREPILSASNTVNAGNQDTPTEQQSTSARSPEGWNEYDDEYLFRVHRTRYFYPDFVTMSMVNDWERHRHSNNYTMATSSAFTAIDPVVVAAAAARSSGSGGSSFSFGGGSSMGGGGGGGSW